MNIPFFLVIEDGVSYTFNCFLYNIGIYILDFGNENFFLWIHFWKYRTQLDSKGMYFSCFIFLTRRVLIWKREPFYDNSYTFTFGILPSFINVMYIDYFLNISSYIFLVKLSFCWVNFLPVLFLFLVREVFQNRTGLFVYFDTSRNNQ